MMLTPLYPAWCILQLADGEAMAMDKIYHCARRVNEMMEEKACKLDQLKHDNKFRVASQLINNVTISSSNVEHSSDE